VFNFARNVCILKQLTNACSELAFHCAALHYKSVADARRLVTKTIKLMRTEELNSNVKECNQCGKCCIKYSNGGLSVSVGQVDYWENYRPDIYRYVNQGSIWIDPETDKQIA